MTVDTNKAAAGAYFDLVLNHGDFDVADRIFARDVVFHYPLGNINGVEAVKTYIRAVRTAFPDIHFTIAALAVEGGHAAARWSLAGSQTGEFKGKPPSGKRVSVPGITWFNVEDGQIREMWCLASAPLGPNSMI